MENANHIRAIIAKQNEQLTNRAWEISHALLWDNHPFSQAEILQAKSYIREYFEQLPLQEYFLRIQKKTKEFLMRVEIAADYVKRKNARYITHPVIWFNPSNAYGFSVTKKWYIENTQRTLYSGIRFYNNNGRLEKRMDRTN
jgi:hypothetical protein